MTDDLIGRAKAQTAIQFAARRYTVAHEAHGEGQVVWSDNLISVTDAMNVLRDLPPVQQEIIRCKDCKYYKYGICMKIGANKSFHGFCDWAERGEQDE